MLDYISTGLMQTTWHIGVFFVIIAIISIVYSNASPSFKYILWSLIIFRVIMPFNFSTLAFISEHDPIPLPEITTVIHSVEAIRQVIPQGIVSNSMKLSQVFQIVWLCGFLSYLLAVVSWVLYSKRHLHRCEKITNSDVLSLVENIRQRLSIRQPIQSYYLHDSIESSPTISGISNLRLYIPKEIADKWDIKDIEPIIIHELVHVKRHDVAFNWIQIVVQAVFFFNPLIWYANSKIRYFREEVCDDMTVGLIENKRKRYSLSILNVLELVTNNKSIELSSVYFSERKSSLARRIMRLANKKYRFYQPLNRSSFALLFIIGIMGFAISCETIPDSIMGDKDSQQEYTVENANTHNDIFVTILNENEVAINGTVVSTMTFPEEIRRQIERTGIKSVRFTLQSNITAITMQRLVENALDAGADNAGINNLTSEEGGK